MSVDALTMGPVGRTVARLCGVAMLRAATILLGFVATATVAGAVWGAQDVALATRPPVRPALTVEGDVRGMVPGARDATLRLTLRNASADPASVTAVTATPTGVTGVPSACADALSAGASHGTVAVPAYGSATVSLPIAVRADLPASCAGATWALRYTAS